MAAYDDEKTKLIEEAEKSGMVLRFTGSIDVANKKVPRPYTLHPEPFTLNRKKGGGGRTPVCGVVCRTLSLPVLDRHTVCRRE